MKIYEKYQAETYRVLRENPYQLAEDIQGVGFRIADEIAARVGIHADSDYRIRCGIFYILQQATLDGHVYLPLPELLTNASQLLGVSEDAVHAQMDNLIMDRKLIAKGDAIFSAAYYYAELSCARMLHDLNVSMMQEQLPSQEAALEKKYEDWGALSEQQD